MASAGNGAEARIDLTNQTVTIAEKMFKFEIAPANKRAIEQGLDLIGNTLLSADAIEDYERDRGPFVPPA
jgi:3-isopropylmalate dehydratase small subunit